MIRIHKRAKRKRQNVAKAGMSKIWGLLFFSTFFKAVSNCLHKEFCTSFLFMKAERLGGVVVRPGGTSSNISCNPQRILERKAVVARLKMSDSFPKKKRKQISTSEKRKKLKRTKGLDGKFQCDKNRVYVSGLTDLPKTVRETAESWQEHDILPSVEKGKTIRILTQTFSKHQSLHPSHLVMTCQLQHIPQPYSTKKLL